MVALLVPNADTEAVEVAQEVALPPPTPPLLPLVVGVRVGGVGVGVPPTARLPLPVLDTVPHREAV